MAKKIIEWIKKHPILTIVLAIVFYTIGSVSLNDAKEKTQVQNLQTEIPKEDVAIMSEYIGQTLKLNSCELDPENADYWQGKEANFWNDKNKTSVSFKLPACDNKELEVIEHDEANKQFKVKYNEQEGWISEMQLIK